MDQPNDFPAELRRPVPRTVRLSGNGWLNLFGAVLFVGLGLTGAVVIVQHFLNEAATQRALSDHGEEATGRITRTWNSKSRPHINYSFSVGGTEFTGNSEVPRTHLGILNMGGSLPIRYIPANPNINHPAAWQDSPRSIFWILVLPATMTWMGLFLVRRFSLQHQLAVHGIAAHGIIARTEWNGPSKGQRNAVYTFRNVNTDEVEIGTCPSDRIYRADSACWVLYLPANPGRSEIYPFPIDFFRIEQ